MPTEPTDQHVAVPRATSLRSAISSACFDDLIGATYRSARGVDGRVRLGSRGPRARFIPDMTRTPVTMLTAKDGEYAETDALDLGADDYLTKPFS
jgi:hypothetical protein